jgi:hypothetical protein
MSRTGFFRPLPVAVLAVSIVVSWLAGCHSIRVGPAAADKADRPDRDPQTAPVLATPGKHSLRVSQFVFLSDFELKRDLPVFDELAQLREQVYKELHLPSTNTVVQVFLFADRDRYERFMRAKYPDLPKRRAFFVAQPRNVGANEDLLVYTYWGDRVKEDLRHELTHALLHSVLKDVPLWLDEGLAEYFEVGADGQGLNGRHLDEIRCCPDGPFKPDLARLEQLGQVEQMTQAEYREAWAWVHLMLRSKPEAKLVVVNYLQQLRSNPNPGPLQPRLAQVFPALEEALNEHLAQLETAPAAAPTVQK